MHRLAGYSIHNHHSRSQQVKPRQVFHSSMCQPIVDHCHRRYSSSVQSLFQSGSNDSSILSFVSSSTSRCTARYLSNMFATTASPVRSVQTCRWDMAMSCSYDRQGKEPQTPSSFFLTTSSNELPKERTAVKASNGRGVRRCMKRMHMLCKCN